MLIDRQRGWWLVTALWCLVGTLPGACTSPETSRESTVEPTQGTATSPDGLAISYDVRGTGPTSLVFVHGWSCDRSYWHGQLDAFLSDYRVVSLDLAGHGASGGDRDAWSIEAYGADVAAVVDALELPSVILIGHSMGGDVIVDAARLLPGRVTGLIWVDTYGQLGDVRSPADVEAFLAPLSADFADSTYAFVRRNLFSPDADPALVERVARDMSSAPPRVALASLESSITNDRIVPGALAELGLPVVSLNPATSNPDVDALERHGVDVVLVPELGHFMMMEDPEAFNRILSGVLTDLVR